MDPIKWLPTFETGNPHIDAEHRDLVDLVNVLIAAFNEGDTGRLHCTAGTFYGRVRAHFAAEEAVLRAGNFPRLAEHSRFHILLEQHVASLVEWCQAATESWTLEACVGALRRFVVDEIIGSDMDFKSHVQEVGMVS